MTDSPDNASFWGDGPMWIGIPVLNRCDLLRRCVAAIDVPARIVIVNNNNVDESFNRELKQLRADDPRVSVLNQDRNLGVAASWNLLLQTAFESGCEWGVIASNDLELHPGALRAASAVLGAEDVGVWHLSAWNCFAVSRDAVMRVGWFDENFYPATRRIRITTAMRSGCGDVPGRGPDVESATIYSDDVYLQANAATHCRFNVEYYLQKWGANWGSETYLRPFNLSQADVRWWPAPRERLRKRDWDVNRVRLRVRDPGITPAALYERARSQPSDIQAHLPVLHKFASSVRHVTEFGVRTGNSTTALLHAGPDRLIGYDVFRQPEVALLEAAARHEGLTFRFMLQDIRGLPDIEPTDLLLLDSVHTHEQVAFELRFAPRVSRYIMLHDTETFGDVGENGGPGIWPAVAEFLRSSPDWELLQHDPRENGLTILRRC